MTTLYPFQPTATQPFQFQPTFDGTVYTVIATWNVTAQRYYINIYSLSGDRIATLPLIGSPADSDINLVEGYFTQSSLVYRQQDNQFEVSP